MFTFLVRFSIRAISIAQLMRTIRTFGGEYWSLFILLCKQISNVGLMHAELTNNLFKPLLPTVKMSMENLVLAFFLSLLKYKVQKELLLCSHIFTCYILDQWGVVDLPFLSPVCIFQRDLIFCVLCFLNKWKSETW